MTEVVICFFKLIALGKEALRDIRRTFRESGISPQRRACVSRIKKNMVFALRGMQRVSRKVINHEFSGDVEAALESALKRCDATYVKQVSGLRQCAGEKYVKFSQKLLFLSDNVRAFVFNQNVRNLH